MKHGWKRCLAGVCGLVLCGGQALGAEKRPFQDIPQEGPEAEAVRFVTEAGIMNGVGGERFEPEGEVTRAMAVTILHRFAGQPEGHGYNEFIDVEEGMWYTDSILWASNDKIVLGYGNGRYGTNDPVTRLQLGTMLHRFAELYGVDTTQRVDLGERYRDPGEDYGDGAAHESLRWAAALRLLVPRREGYIDAALPATRLEAAWAIQNLGDYYGKEAFQSIPEQEIAKTNILSMEEESTRGHLEVSYQVTFRYQDGTEQTKKVNRVLKASPDSLPEEVSFLLLCNHRKGGADADAVFFEDFWREDCVGVTVSVDSLTFGRNTAYPKRAFRVNAGNYTQDRKMRDSAFYDGEVTIAVEGERIGISCQDGKFLGDTNISLVLTRPVRRGEAP